MVENWLEACLYKVKLFDIEMNFDVKNVLRDIITKF